MATLLSPCIDAFILTVLCNSPIKGSFKTLLNGTILTLDQKIVELTVQLGRFNILNRILALELQTVNALKDKISADMNLVLEPFQQFSGCAGIQTFSKILQDNAVSKNAAAIQNKIAELNEVTNLTKLQNASIKYWEDKRDFLQAFVNRIDELCP